MEGAIWGTVSIGHESRGDSTRAHRQARLACMNRRSWRGCGLRTGPALVGVLLVVWACGGTPQTSRDIEGSWIWAFAEVAGEPFLLDPDLSTREIPGVPGGCGSTLTGPSPGRVYATGSRLDGGSTATSLPRRTQR